MKIMFASFIYTLIKLFEFLLFIEKRNAITALESWKVTQSLKFSHFWILPVHKLKSSLKKIALCSGEVI